MDIKQVENAKDKLDEVRLLLAFHLNMSPVNIGCFDNVYSALNSVKEVITENNKLKSDLNKIHKQKAHEHAIKDAFYATDPASRIDLRWMQYQNVVMTGEMNENGVLSLKALKNRYCGTRIKKIEINLEV